MRKGSHSKRGKSAWKVLRDDTRAEAERMHSFPAWPFRCTYQFLTSTATQTRKRKRHSNGKDRNVFESLLSTCLLPLFCQYVPLEIAILIQTYVVNVQKPGSILLMIEKWTERNIPKFFQVKNLISCSTHGISYLVRSTYPKHGGACARGHYPVPKFTQYTWAGIDEFSCFPFDFSSEETNILVWRYPRPAGDWIPVRIKCQEFDPFFDYEMRDPNCDQCYIVKK